MAGTGPVTRTATRDRDRYVDSGLGERAEDVSSGRAVASVFPGLWEAGERARVRCTDAWNRGLGQARPGF